MTSIALLTPSISPGDAVSNDVIGMEAALTKRGHRVQIFADACSITNQKVLPSSRIRSFLNGSNDVLIYHYSMGWDTGLEILRDAPCKKVIKYHNVTPPGFFTKFSEAHVLMSYGGRKQLKDIATAGCDLYLSASEYNMRELIAEGADESLNFVVPPFHHIDRLNLTAPDPQVMATCDNGLTNVLMVGRIVPHKGHRELIEAFANYYYHYNRNSRLFIVGKHDAAFNNYSKLLQDMVHGLKLQDAVVFTGGVAEATLKAYYLVADVFLITSNHEGFCVPLVEAMAMNLPIVAYASSAIPDTAGNAALVWPERDPILAAESINAIVEDAGVAEVLGKLGRQRYEQLFTNERIEEKFIAAIDKLL
ncbi:MAG TPA: glycosyltransferase family 4 protein [Pyrinomonadaceae bacterium]